MQATQGGYVNPYDNPAHYSWIADGYCAAIHVSKAWCNGVTGHSGDHHSPHLSPTGRSVDAYLYWNDAENHSR